MSNIPDPDKTPPVDIDGDNNDVTIEVPDEHVTDPVYGDEGDAEDE